MKRIDKITLERPLPEVFRGAEHDQPVASSQLWLQTVELRRGTTYLIEAESGTGKSSLCSYIYGSRRDYRGKIFFNDTDIRNLSIKEWCGIRRSHLAYLPQEMRLFGELTAMENIAVKNRLTGHFDTDAILEMMSRLEIDHKADAPASRLSVGQQQRVAIVRSLCQPFDFILLDEPVSHLDERNNRLVASLIADEAKRNGASVITTSVGNPLLIDTIEAIGEVVCIKM